MKKESPTISVVMPVYNGEKYLVEAIDSILNQTFKNFEFIIINDGSTDDTEKIILSYKEQRIIYVKNEVNLKLIKTLNKGIDIAQGKYIARMDADDISMPNRFELQIDTFEKNIGIDIVCSKYLLLEQNGNSFRKNKTFTLVNSEAIKYTSIFQTMVGHPTVMIKAELLKLFKYKDSIDSEHIEDFELWNRLFANGSTFYTINKELLYYRVNPTSINNTMGNIQNLRITKITQQILNNQYNFQFDEQALKLLQGDFKICNFKLLRKLDKSLTSFFLKINDSISAKGFDDLILWKKHKIFTVCVLSISKVDFVDKVGIFLFLLTKTLWLKDPQWRSKLFDIFYE